MINIKEKSYSNAGNSDILQYVSLPGKILDIGCGAGDNAKILNSRGFIVDGITISERELKEAMPFLNRGFLYNIENGLPAEVKCQKYDYIICSHVLEHICYPHKLMEDIKYCLHKHGKLIIALPNLFHYASRWKLVRGEFNYQNAGIWDDTHFRWYTYKSGRRLLENYNYKVIINTVSGELPGNSFFSRFLSQKIRTAIYNKIKNIAPALLGYQLIYVAILENF